MEVNLNVIDQWLAAISSIAYRSRHVLRKFVITVHNGKSSVWQREGQRRATHTERLTDSYVVVHSRVLVLIMLILTIHYLHGKTLCPNRIETKQ